MLTLPLYLKLLIVDLSEIEFGLLLFRLSIELLLKALLVLK